MHELADLLNTFVTSSAAPYGKEYSVRWRNGFADHNRFLMSIHKLALADSAKQARQRLEQFLDQLSCPPESSQQLWEVWDDTCVVHFGFEQTSTCQPYLKVYFELTAQDRVDMHREQLIHVAVKWNPQNAESAALSRYSLVPCPDRNALSRQLSLLCPELFLPELESLIGKALARCDASELMLLAIADDNSPRKSCDLNLYNSHMTIQESQSELVGLAALNDCQADDWLTSQQERHLGHLAAGRDRNRNDFVTLYYGIEAH